MWIGDKNCMQLTKHVNNAYNHNTEDIYEKKVENGSRERENIPRKNLIGTYSILCNSTFPTLCQKLLFSCYCFSSFLLFWNLLLSGFHSVRIKLNSKWFVTFALSVLWCWSYLIYKSLKSQFSNQTIFWKFRNFKLIKYSRVKF